MLRYHKYNTVASVLTAVITIIGVAAALIYYLSLKTNKLVIFLIVFMIYSIIIIASIFVTRWRLKQDE